MKAFPKLSRSAILEVFNSFIELYANDLEKILEATERATLLNTQPFTISPTAQISVQLDHIRVLVQRTTSSAGRDLLVRIIEELQSDLLVTGVIGVSNNAFHDKSFIELENDNYLRLKSDQKWWFDWGVKMDYGTDTISIQIRNRAVTTNDIVPDYIVQYVVQSIDAFNRNHHLTALALISIALEGVLRDALEVKGYTYVYGAQVNDAYAIEEMEVYPEATGFIVKFPVNKPRPHADFLTESHKPSPERVRIKRVEHNGNWRLEIRDADYLKEFWSSSGVATPGTGITNIGGLGTALHVARGPANILDNAILPSDMDELVQLVRNSLIHLSGTTISTPISSLGGVTLEQFSNDKSKVFDAIWSISRVIVFLF